MCDILLAAAITHLGTRRDTDWTYEPPPRILLRVAATFALLGGLLAVLEFTARGAV